MKQSQEYPDFYGAPCKTPLRKPFRLTGWLPSVAAHLPTLKGHPPLYGALCLPTRRAENSLSWIIAPLKALDLRFVLLCKTPLRKSFRLTGWLPSVAAPSGKIRCLGLLAVHLSLLRYKFAESKFFTPTKASPRRAGVLRTTAHLPKSAK